MTWLTPLACSADAAAISCTSSDVRPIAGTRKRGATPEEDAALAAELGARYAVSSEGPRHADFTGFECRWQPVPNRAGQFVSLLVQAVSQDPEEAARVYLATIQLVDDVLGTINKHPLGQSLSRRVNEAITMCFLAGLALFGSAASVAFAFSKSRASRVGAPPSLPSAPPPSPGAPSASPSR